jgi:hypothetical protein
MAETEESNDDDDDDDGRGPYITNARKTVLHQTVDSYHLLYLKQHVDLEIRSGDYGGAGYHRGSGCL